MSTWNAIYFKGTVPSGFRPAVEGTCVVRRVSAWIEISLPGVADGEATAIALSKRVSGQVVWALVQTTAGVVAVTHYENGKALRSLEFADGLWRKVEGEPQPWETWLFSDEELAAARDLGAPEDDEELEKAFARKTLEAGQRLPWPREWETFFHALGVTEAEWNAARAREPLATLEGSKTSKLTIFARVALLAVIASVSGLWLTRDAAFGGLATSSALFAFGAGFVRKASVGRWFL